MAGGSAVIGILKALLTAETGEYSAAMRAAGTEAQELGKKLEKDLEPRQRTINKLVSEFLGGNEIRRAQEYAAAVEKLGGVTSLTAADQLKVNRAVNDALGHYQALGIQAPKNLTDLEQATRKAATTTTFLGDAQKHVQSELASTGTRIRDYALGFLTGEAAMQLFSAAGRFVVQFLKDSVSEALAAEQAQRKLTAALQQQGLATPQIIKQYDDLATQFAKTTIHTDDLIIEMQGLLTTVGGVLPSQMEVALEAATNLSAGLGIDLRAATILVSKAFEDNFVSLKKTGVQINETRAKAEGMTYVLGQVQAKFGGQAAAEVDTYAGKITQLGNAYKEMQEQLGKTLFETGAMDAALLAARIGMVFLQVEVMKAGAAMSVAFSPSKWAEHGGVVGAFAAELARMNAELAKAAAAPTIKPVRSTLSQVEQDAVDRRKADEEANKAAEKRKKLLEELKRAQEAYNKAIAEGAKHLTGDDAIAAMKLLTAQILEAGGAQKIHASRLSEVIKKIDEWRDAGLALNPVLEKTYRTNLDFTRSMPATVSLFDQWAKTAARAADETKRFAVTLSNLPPGTSWFGDVPKATTELSDLGAEIVAMVDRTEEAKEVFSGFGIAAQMGFGAVASFLDDLGAAVGGAKGQVMSFAAQFVLSMSQVKNTTQASEVAVSSFYGGFASVFTNIIGDIISANRSAELLRKQIQALEQAVRDLNAVPFDNRSLEQSFREIEAFRRANPGVDIPISMRFVPHQIALQKQIDDITAAMERAGLSMEDLGGVSGSLAKGIETLIKDFGILSGQGFTLTQITKGNASALNEVLLAAFNTGGKIPEALAPMMRELINAGLLSDELRRKFLGLADPVPWKEMEEIAKEFGIDLASLGPQFQQAKLSETAEEFAQKFLLLVNNGADVGAVIAGMGKKANDFLNNALKWGLELPPSMKPLIEKMFEAGELVDENGEKITDLSKLKYGKTLADELDPLLVALNKLIDVLTKGVPDAATEMARRFGQVIKNNSWVVPASVGVPNGFGVGDSESGGGAPASFASPMSFASSMPSVSAASMGARGGTMTVNVMMDGRSLARAAVPFIPESVSNIGLRAR